MYTVHICFHAHLDPIWLWPWQAGLDEALATCRSACDRLDANPDIFFTQGEAWVYRQVQLLDPALFRRIQKFVKAGRWEIAGGWWTQPDCNAPDYNGFEHQIALGKRYFQENFGQFPEYAFNPDSFGHNAALPELMWNERQKHYIMMRPMDHELSLPYRFFRWRGVPGGPTVTVFRIPQSYVLSSVVKDEELFRDRINSCIDGLPEGIQDTMCFAGLGDHGGGPTEELIARLREWQGRIPGVKLQFSTPSRFYKAVSRKVKDLPVIEGELQFHSIGCYSVHREGKLALQKATQRMTQAEFALKTMPEDHAEALQLEEHWRNVVFHQFHDTLGGTCIPSAYRHVRNQLGAGEAWAEEKLQYVLRKKLADFPADECQRMVFYNASDKPFEGWVHAEPWMEGKGVQDYRLVDEKDRPVPYQCVLRECLLSEDCRDSYELYLKLKPMEIRTVRLKPRQTPALASGMGKTGLQGDSCGMQNDKGAGIDSRNCRMTVNHQEFSLPELVLCPDASDTWTHVLDRYSDAHPKYPRWNAFTLMESGAHLWEITRSGTIGRSQLHQTFRLADNSAEVEMTLRIDWNEQNKILKLQCTLPENCPDTRRDAIPGHGFTRPQDGKECSIQGWTRVELDRTRAFAVLCPDVFALDGTPERLRFTLLRAPQFAHHTPAPGGRPDVPYTDRGEHLFRFRFMVGKCEEHALQNALAGMLRPLVYADLTRGMKGLRSGDIPF